MNGNLARQMSRTQKILLLALGVGAVTAPVALGLIRVPQTSPDSSGKQSVPFDVVSIRPDRSGTYSMSIGFSPTMYTAKDVFAETLLEAAFQVSNFQVIGGPQWIHSDRYTVEAKFPTGMDPQKLPPEEGMKQFSLMVRSMLVQRFHLQYHISSREFPGYAMVVSKGGPKLQEAKPNEGFSELVTNDKITAHGFTALDIADQIGLNLSQKVKDETGLTGKYSFTLSYPADQDDAGTNTQADSGDLGAKARLITALQEQLGLKLIAEKMSLPVIVVDHIDPPTPN